MRPSPYASTGDQCHTAGDSTGCPRRTSKSHRAAKSSATAAERVVVAARTDASASAIVDASAAAAGASPNSSTSRRVTADGTGRRRRPATGRPVDPPASPGRIITDAGVPRAAAAAAARRVLTTPLDGEGVARAVPPSQEKSPAPLVIVAAVALVVAAATARGSMDVRGRLDARRAGRVGVAGERASVGDDTGEPGGESRWGEMGEVGVDVIMKERG